MRRRSLIRSLAFCVAIALGLPLRASVLPQGQGQPASGAPCAVGTPAVMELDLRGLDGKALRVEQASGRALLLVFLTTWAPPSKGQLRVIASEQARWKTRKLDTLTVVLPPADSDAVGTLLRSEGIDTPVAVAASDTKIRRHYPFSVVPAAFLVDTRGAIAACYSGVATAERIDADLSRLVAKSAP